MLFGLIFSAQNLNIMWRFFQLLREAKVFLPANNFFLYLKFLQSCALT